MIINILTTFLVFSVLKIFRDVGTKKNQTNATEIKYMVFLTMFYGCAWVNTKQHVLHQY